MDSLAGILSRQSPWVHILPESMEIEHANLPDEALGHLGESLPSAQVTLSRASCSRHAPDGPVHLAVEPELGEGFPV
jgi:hypothetical protein